MPGPDRYVVTRLVDTTEEVVELIDAEMSVSLVRIKFVQDEVRSAVINSEVVAHVVSALEQVARVLNLFPQATVEFPDWE